MEKTMLNNITNTETNEKMCPRCGQVKQLENNGYCKDCTKEYNKQYYENNKGYHRQYREKQKGYYLYIIEDNKSISYVGATEYLQSRLNGHINCHNENTKEIFMYNNWTAIKYLNITNIVQNREEMLLLENALIEIYNTKYNTKKNIIKNIDNLRMFSLLAEVHGLNEHWITYSTNI